MRAHVLFFRGVGEQVRTQRRSPNKFFRGLLPRTGIFRDNNALCGEAVAMKKFLVKLVLVLLVLSGAYLWVVLSWSYSTGERAGWVQKFSKKGFVCKTWEGELSMVAMPGAIPEKFLFTVRDDGVAEQINRVMGKRVALRYEQHLGLPTDCMGDTQYFVDKVVVVE